MVDLLGYHEPGDGGGGRFYWQSASSALSVDGVTVIAAEGGKGVWRRIMEGNGMLNIRWFGARGDGKSDDTQAIQKALDLATLTGRGAGRSPSTAIWFPAGNYRVTRTLVVESGPLTLQGQNSRTTALVYDGEPFKDLIQFRLKKRKLRQIHLFDLGFNGGSKARYCVWAEEFTSGCHMVRCSLRYGVGLLFLDGFYYSNISNNEFRYVSLPKEGATAKQLAEVHGPGKAPVYMVGGGSSVVHQNTYSHLSLPEESPVRTDSSILIRSGGSSFTNNAIESVWGEDGVKGTPEVLLTFEGIIHIGELYLEKVGARKALIRSAGCPIRNALIYFVKAETLFVATGPDDLLVSDTRIIRAMANDLYRVEATSPPSAKGIDVVFHRTSLSPGERYGSKASGDLWFDAHGSGFNPMGMRDSDGRGRLPLRSHAARWIEGYEARLSRDQHGPLVEVHGGAFRREDGEVVINGVLRRLVDNVLEGVASGEKVTYRPLPHLLRFPAKKEDRLNRWYRFYIGKAGQPYLTVYPKMPAEPGGNWLFQFRLDEEERFTSLAANPVVQLPKLPKVEKK